MFEGTTTALITPFDKNGEVNYEGLAKNIKFQLESGVDHLLPLGTTGETPTLTKEEQTKIIQVVVKNANGHNVIVGVGTNNTKTTIENAKHAEELGATGIMVVTPYYNKPTQEGIYQHFKAVHDASSLPILVYNIKGRTGKNIETSTMKRIAELERVVAIKEASGDIDQIMDVINETDLTILSGDDGMTYPLMALGGSGVVSVASNLIPDKVSTMVNHALDGNLHESLALHYELLPIFRGIFVEINPAPVKAAMNLKGMPAGDVRLPLVNISKESLEFLKGLL